MDPEELALFQRIADVWWSDAALPLKLMNEVRIPYIIEKLESEGIIKKESAGSERPLNGVSVLDVGCGGGFLTEPFAKLGAEVTGIDGCPELIEVAKKHATEEGQSFPNLTYHADTIQDFAKKSTKQYDVVFALEFIDHVSDKAGVIEALSKCLRPGGSVFFSTMNKCYLSWIFCKIVPEYVCRYFPMGAHDYEKFISPEDMGKILESHNCVVKDVKGLYYNYFRGYWFWLRSTSTWYMMHAVKNSEN